jgi:multicomponent Na+:H+ antiporter subunit D
VAALVLLTSLMALVYVWRVIETAYLQPPVPGKEPVREAPLSLLIPTWALVLGNLYFGIDASLTTGVASRAAEILLGGAP